MQYLDALYDGVEAICRIIYSNNLRKEEYNEKRRKKKKIRDGTVFQTGKERDSGEERCICSIFTVAVIRNSRVDRTVF